MAICDRHHTSVESFNPVILRNSFDSFATLAAIRRARSRSAAWLFELLSAMIADDHANSEN
jgi:hypothetical protein